MQRPGRYVLPVVAALALGCAGNHKHWAGESAGARYGWPHKQGKPEPPVSGQREAEGREPAPASTFSPQLLIPGAGADLVESASAASTRTDFPASSPSASILLPPLPAPNTTVPPGPDTTDYFGGEARTWNVKAIAAAPVAAAALAFGIASQSLLILVIGGAIAFALGVIGSRQCRDRRSRGKAFALVGMILGGAAMFFGAMALIWAA